MGKCALRMASIAAALAAMPAAAPAICQCMLCNGNDSTPAKDAPQRQLAVEVGTSLDFDRVAVAAPDGGSVELDPMNRSRLIRGGLTDLGGLAMVGTATVRGEPGRAVRVDLPRGVTLTSSDGSIARIDRLTTDLPPEPRLGPDGLLRFSFGGRLDVSGDAAGDYRGRIAITVDYQ